MGGRGPGGKDCSDLNAHSFVSFSVGLLPKLCCSRQVYFWPSLFNGSQVPYSPFSRTPSRGLKACSPAPTRRVFPRIVSFPTPNPKCQPQEFLSRTLGHSRNFLGFKGIKCKNSLGLRGQPSPLEAQAPKPPSSQAPKPPSPRL